MASYTRYRILSLLPLLTIPLGIVLFVTRIAVTWGIVEIIFYLQTASVLVAIPAYMMGTGHGMARSVLILLVLIFAVLYLALVWGSIIAFNMGDGLMYGA